MIYAEGEVIFLDREETARNEQAAVESMQRINERLSAYIDDLERHNREIALLGGLGTLLQTCRTLEDAHAAIARVLRKLFVTESGAVYLIDASRDALEPVAGWGDQRPVDEVLKLERGWSLLQERSFTGETDDSPLLCYEGRQEDGDVYFCAPMVDRKETIGLLYVQFNPDRLRRHGEARDLLIKHKRRLAVTAAETIALSLGNIRLRESLYDQSIHDPLTGLLNRRSMDELLEKELLRMARKQQPMSIIMLDIDFFKRFNDTHGHEAGDALLREFGGFLRKHVRGGDFACRYGGEEFVLLLSETSLEHAWRRAEQVRAEIAQLVVHYRGKPLDSITLSMGVAAFPQHGGAARELLQSADSALYRAKAGGRNRVAIAQTDGMNV